MGLLAVDAPTGGGTCKKQCHTRRHALARGFLRRIGDRRVCSCFPARLPLEGRSEGVTSVGVLFDRNGGRRKISSVKVAGGKVLR